MTAVQFTVFLVSSSSSLGTASSEGAGQLVLSNPIDTEVTSRVSSSLPLLVSQTF